MISIKPTKAYARPKIAMLYGINGIESILVIPKAIAYSNDKNKQIIIGIQKVEIVLHVMTCFGAYTAKACPIPDFRAYG